MKIFNRKDSYQSSSRDHQEKKLAATNFDVADGTLDELMQSVKSNYPDNKLLPQELQSYGMLN